MKGNYFLVRHAQAQWRSDSSDPFLSHLGRKQAKLLSEFTLTMPVKLIISSPLNRAVETATIISKLISCPLEIDNNIREKEPEESYFELIDRANNWLNQSTSIGEGTLLLSHGGFLNALIETRGITLPSKIPKDRFGSLVGIAEIISLESFQYGSHAVRIY